MFNLIKNEPELDQPAKFTRKRSSKASLNGNESRVFTEGDHLAENIGCVCIGAYRSFRRSLCSERFDCDDDTRGCEMVSKRWPTCAD